MAELLVTLRTMRFSDLVDILMVAIFFYAIFALLHESRSKVALRGFITVMLGSLLIYLLAQAWNMRALVMIFENFWIIVVLVFLIVFQNEFKKALTDVGQLRVFRPFFPQREDDVLDQVLQAVKLMSKNRTGALIVFERRNPLRSYTGTGTMIDAVVSAEMIRTIFTAFSPATTAR